MARYPEDVTRRRQKGAREPEHVSLGHDQCDGGSMASYCKAFRLPLHAADRPNPSAAPSEPSTVYREAKYLTSGGCPLTAHTMCIHEGVLGGY